MTEKSNGEKNWLRWALRAILVGSIALATTLITTTIDRLADAVATLRCEVQGLQVDGLQVQSLLVSRITRLEARLGLDP